VQTQFLRFNCYTSDLQAEILSFVDGVAEADAKDLVIPATVDFEGKTYKVVKVLENAFKNNTTITSVTFNENLTEIESAFTGCKNLTTVNFTEAEDLTTIAAGAFTGTAITALDLSENTKITTIGNLFGTTAEVKNATLTGVTLPKTVTSIAENAFLNCTALTDVKFEAADNPQTIGVGAFAGTAIATLDLSKTKVAAINNLFGTTASVKNATLTGVTLPKTVTTIAENAFQYCTALATVTFADLKEGAANVSSIGAGAFVKTAITTLDLTKTKITDLNRLFENVNNKVTTVILPATLANIKERAFEGLGALTKVDFTACNITTAFTIEANAFNTTVLLKSIELPAINLVLKENSFAKTYLTEVIFKGDLGAGSVKAGAFVRNDAQEIKVTYKPTITVVYNCFEQGAFAAANTDVWVTFNTTEDYGAEVASHIADYPADTKGNQIYGVKLVFTASEAESDGTIAVAKKDGVGSYYYGTFITTAAIKIAKKQGEANVMVYGAYVDNADATAIMMDQLHLIGGYYYIPANVNIIVKSSKEADVEYWADDSGNDSQNYQKSSTTSQNKIQAADAESFAATIKQANAGKVVYFLAPIAEYGFLWTQFKDERIIPKGLFYLIAEPSAAPARVVWLDGSEDDQVTGIETVETKKVVVDGVTYNLAGQKVNANYKGVVIKDGKKFFQK